MIYKVLTMIAMMLAVAAGMPVEKRLALLEAKADVLKEALADKVSADDVDEQLISTTTAGIIDAAVAGIGLATAPLIMAIGW